MPTAIITGARGQDGSILAELLTARGYRVIGIARGKPTATEAALQPGTRFVDVDLGNLNAVRDLVEAWQPDEIYHLAAFHHSSQEGALSSAVTAKESMLAANFLFTKNLAFALADMESSCHLVFASSSQIFTAQAEHHLVTEETPRQPSTFYGLTKSWAMDLLAVMRKETRLRTSSAILFNHESPRRPLQFVSRKITHAAAQAAKGALPRLHLQNIGSRVDWSSARDVVQALSLMGRAEVPRDYVVASGALHSVREFLELAFGHVGLDWKRFTTFSEDTSVPALVGDPHALEHALSWQRAASFEDLVTEMVEHDLSGDEAGS